MRSIEGHEDDITHMLNGGYRAECSCGWWEDLPHLEHAEQSIDCHRAGLLIRQHAVPGCAGCENDAAMLASDARTAADFRAAMIGLQHRHRTGHPEIHGQVYCTKYERARIRSAVAKFQHAERRALREQQTMAAIVEINARSIAV
jgi:hypothetical protein